MKKTIYILLVFCFACSTSDDDAANGNTSTLEVTVTQDLNTVAIDQIVTLTATANETINEISFSTDGGITFPSSYGSNFGTTANLYFSFDTLGTKTIVYRVKNNAGDIVDSTVTINVERGNAIQIQSLQLNSFFNMGETWDDEFGGADLNRLADVFFVILKANLNAFDGTRSSGGVWYRSEIRSNEENLNWNLQNEELFINLNELTARIAFADDDGGEVVQDLMLGPPFERVIPFADFASAETNPVLVQETDIDLEYQITVDW